MSSRLKNAASTVVAALVVASPRLAFACSVCSAGRDDETRAAFIGTTALLSLLPLALIGGAVLWLRRRVRRIAEENENPRVEAPVLPRATTPR